MEVSEALAREKAWRESPQSRPQPGVAKSVAAALADSVRQLEDQLVLAQRLAVGRHIQILRGNPGRGQETGPGFGRKIPAVIEEVFGVGQVRCKLLADDPNAVGAPCLAGESGWWSVSQIILFV